MSQKTLDAIAKREKARAAELAKRAKTTAAPARPESPAAKPKPKSGA